jgi:gluconate 2-dehydrogenase gamma chain
MPVNTRRSFLKSSAAAVGGSWAVATAPAALAIFDLACSNQAAGQFAVLSASEAAQIEALTALIVPSDATGPGAREAGVVWYVDAALSQDHEDLAFVRSELVKLAETIREAHGVSALADLGPEQQLAVATSIQDTDFFDSMRDAALSGMLAHPKHGGNRDKLGWQLIGFDDRHAWQPPFGHYDAPYHEDDPA